jgi:ATP-binding cassette subfamily B protein
MTSLRKLLPLLRPYRGQAALSLVSVALAVVLDLAIPRLVQRIIDDGIRAQDRSVVLGTAAWMLSISVVSTVIVLIQNRASVLVGESVARDLRATLFARVQSWSLGNLDRLRTGELLVRLTSDVNALKGLVQVSLRIGVRAPLLMLGSLALMVRTSPILALALLPLLVVTGVLIGMFVSKTEPLVRRMQQRLDALNTVLQENIAGARVVKALVRGRHEERRFGGANQAMADSAIVSMRAMSSMAPALTMCIHAGVVLVVWQGGLQAIHGALTLGQIVAFTNYLMTTMAPLVMMTMLSNVLAAGIASARRVDEILTTAPDVTDAPDAAELASTGPAKVRYEGVTFSYPGEGNEPVLRDLVLEAKPGQTVAVLGATGAGKSTLVNLLPRFYDPQAGRITFDGVDVRTVTRDSLLRRVAMVPQDSILFSGTVRDNIRYGRPDASDDDVIAAARAAQAHDFIAALPNGYDTQVAARGANLSGGQRQRVAIARALLVRPDVLVLDDSTSSVDVETETRIQDAFEHERARRTTFVVAQRISTVLKADKIVVLDQGRVVAAGSHAELLATSAVYREIYDSQLGDGAAVDGAAVDGTAPSGPTGEPPP